MFITHITTMDKLCSSKQAQPSYWTEHCRENMKPTVDVYFGDYLIFEKKNSGSFSMRNFSTKWDEYNYF